MTERAPLSPSLRGNPDLDTWIAIRTDGTVAISTGKVEIGQGIVTAIARIGAEELDVSIERVRVESADTARGPNEGVTSGSNSVEHSGNAVRQAAAEARQLLLELAAERLGAPLSALEVEDGTVSARGSDRSVTYWELFGGRSFDRKVTGEAVPKPAEAYSIVGRPGARIDLEAKLTGGAFLVDMTLPGMLFGRVARPPSYRAELLAVDEEAARKLPGVVAVVRDGNFLGVVAEREEQAVFAREQLLDSARWREQETLPPQDRLYEWLLEQPRESYPVVDGVPEQRPVEPHEDPPDAALTLEATYCRPYHMHGSIGPSAALAVQQHDMLTIWSHSQGISVTRQAIAQALGIADDAIRLIHADGPGCYGNNGADDVTFDAALLARAVPGRPVMLSLTRQEEHTWEPYGPAMVVKLRGSLGAGARVIDWSHETFSNSHIGRPRAFGEQSQLAAAWLRAEPMQRPEPRAMLFSHVGIHRNADPLYAFPAKRVVKHLVKPTPLRTSSLRGLGAYANVFAIESFMDELAHAADVDPVEFRLRHLRDRRARELVETAAERSGWRGPAGEGRGQGFGFARYKNSAAYAAVVVELEVDRETGEIRLLRALIAGDAGQVVDPDGLVNQLEGGFVQAASWTLKEEVRFDRTRITSCDWESYPILSFPEVPEVETVVLERPGAPFLGVGEATQGPTPAAIANAIFHATGARLRTLPFTPDRVRAAL